MSAALTRAIAQEIAASGGRLSFARYMELALYAPGLGYYMAGARKLGRDGDFVTAPEISPALRPRRWRGSSRRSSPRASRRSWRSARAAARLPPTCCSSWSASGARPARYLILELSADLRSRSRDTLAARAPRHLERVAWLNRLPPAFTGIVIGNEVLDAMPVHRVMRRGGETLEGCVGHDAARDEFLDLDRPAADEVPRVRPKNCRSPTTATGRRSSCTPARSSAAWAHRSTRGVALVLRLRLPAARVLPSAARRAAR